uniref:Uncharacterized protein n=1 Tax=Romanomermis culicivorax TaxID=13658 RepID=A0A915HY64_ROMCU
MEETETKERMRGKQEKCYTENKENKGKTVEEEGHLPQKIENGRLQRISVVAASAIPPVVARSADIQSFMNTNPALKSLCKWRRKTLSKVNEKQFESLRTEYETLQQRFTQLKTEKQNLRSDSDRRLQNLKSEMESEKKNLKNTIEDLRSAQVIYSSVNNEKRNVLVNSSLENGGESRTNVDLNMPKQTNVVNSQLAQPIPAATLNENKHEHLSESVNVVAVGDDKVDSNIRENEQNQVLEAPIINDKSKRVAKVDENRAAEDIQLPSNFLCYFNVSKKKSKLIEKDIWSLFWAIFLYNIAEMFPPFLFPIEDSENAIQNANDDDFNEHQVKNDKDGLNDDGADVK